MAIEPVSTTWIVRVKRNGVIAKNGNISNGLNGTSCKKMEERSQPQILRQAQPSKMGIDKDDKKPPTKQPELTHSLVTIAPDGGWGWIILAVSTWDCLCIDGTSLAYSVIQKQVSEYLSITDAQSAMFVSIFNCVVYLMGPITAAIANRFGFKMLNIIGGALGAAALAGCAYSPTFILVLILYSVITGIGGAPMYMVCMAAPGYWFDKKRSLAFGISNSATGIACLTIPPLCKVVAQQNWHMVYFFAAGMYAVAFLGGFLIRKPHTKLVEVEGYQPEVEKPIPVSMSMSILNVRGAGGGNKSVEEKMKQMSYHTLQAQQKAGASSPRSRLSEPSIEIETKSCWEKVSPCCGKKEEDIQIERPLYKSDIFLTSRGELQQANKNEAEQLLETHKMTTARDIKQQLSRECHSCPEAISRPLKDIMLSLLLLKNFVYFTFLLSSMTYFSAIYVTYLYVPRTSERKGLGEETGILILQFFGGFMALSRISLAIIFHFWPELLPHYFTSIYVTLGGVCHICLAFTKQKVMQYVFGSAMGFLCGVWVPMRSVLVVRYIGVEPLTNVMGMLFVFQAVGSLLGAPVAQALSTVFNEDYMTYYFAGSMYALTGVLAIPLECFNNRVQRRKKRSSNSQQGTVYEDPIQDNLVTTGTG